MDQYANMLKDANAELLIKENAMKNMQQRKLGWQIARLRFQLSQNGGAPMLQRTVPYSRAASWVGILTVNRNILPNTFEMSKDILKDF